MTWVAGWCPPPFFNSHSLLMYTSDDVIDFDLYDEPRLHMEVLLKAHLTEFDLPLRILLALERAGIRRVGDLVKQDHDKLMAIWNLGKVSVAKIEAFMARYDFYYGMK